VGCPDPGLNPRPQGWQTVTGTIEPSQVLVHTDTQGGHQ
jgi:hypothetical protein